MTSSVWRGWRFVHPDLDDPGIRPGIIRAPSGALAMVEGGAAVRQALLLLLTTRPGERVMRPSYGCDLYRLIFSPNDATTAGLAIHYVRRAVEQFEPRVDLVRVDAGPHPDRPERIVVTVDYRVRLTRQADQLELELDLDGGR